MVKGPQLTRMATAKLTRISGRKPLLIKLRVVLRRVMKVGAFPPLLYRSLGRLSDIRCMLAGDGGSIPFNTQFFHDDDDDGPGFDDGFDADLAGTADPGEQDLLAGTQGKTRRVRPEFINYTKRAKRVDVRKLKENIWKGLKILPTPDEQQPEETMVRDSSLSLKNIFAYADLNRTSLFWHCRTLRETYRWAPQIPRKRARLTK